MKNKKESFELQALAKRIKDHYQSADRLVATAKEKANEAITEVLLCGKALSEAKALVGHGGWLKWLKKNCKGVSARTAQKYMKLSNTNHGSDLIGAFSVRQAYIAAGIIADDEPEIVEVEPALAVPPAMKVNTFAPVPSGTGMASWEKLPVDPVPVIKSVVMDLLKLLKDVSKKDGKALLKPLKAWL